jgi:ethanolamine ammonia-lyase small subunit
VQRECIQSPDVQIIVGDGLSANAVMQNAPAMLQTLTHDLQQRGLKIGTAVFVRHCRAKLMDVIGQLVGAKVGIILIGERPGLGTGDGMSAYLVWQPHLQRTDAEKQAISNIHRRGLFPEDAGHHAARLIEAILVQQTSGVNLDLSRVELPTPRRQRINQAHPEPSMECGQSHGQTCREHERGEPGRICQRGHDQPCKVHTH